MKELKLNNTAEVALVDDEDHERLAKFNWHKTGKNSTNIQRVYSVPTNSRRMPLMSRHVSLASEIMNSPGVTFDHINRNMFDNRKESLRKTTWSQNGANKAKRSGCSSIYKGVTWAKARNKWCVYIMVHYKSINLGYFTDEKEAALAYNEAAIRYFGDFAVLNVVS